MTEQQIQSHRIKELEAEGYYVIKLINTNKNGIPDLIAIPKGANVLFSEVKTPKGKVSKLQEYRLKELKENGFKTEIYTGDSAKHLPILNGWTQKVGGVLHNRGQMFYEVEFLKQQDEYPVFLGMNLIDADDYLDYINRKQILKSNEEIQLDEFFYKNFNSDNQRSL